MLSISPVSVALVNIKLGPTVAAVGQIGPLRGAGEPAPLKKLTIPWRPPQEKADLLSLLGWRTRISDFAGQEDNLAILDAWAKSSLPISVKFVCGPGGAGKSRLAAQFGDSLQKQKWAAGFVRLGMTQRFQVTKRRGILLIVDYPEENPEGVSELLRDLGEMQCDCPLRVLFLTREPPDRWERVVLGRETRDFVDLRPVEVGTLAGPSAFRLYLSALGEAARLFNTVPIHLSEADLTAWLEDAPENNRALFVLALAVHSAKNLEDNVVRYSGPEIVQALAKREYERLSGRGQRRKLDCPDSFARLLAMAAFADELSIPQVEKLAGNSLVQLGFRSPAEMRSQLRLSGILSGEVITAPKPDIVAAAFVICVLGEAPELAPELIWAALEPDLEGGLRRLARLNHDAEVVLGIRAHTIKKWLAEAVRGQPQRCSLLDSVFRDELPLGLVDAAIAAGQTLLDTNPDDEEKARLQNNLSVGLAASGDNPRALEVIHEAVQIYRRLAQANAARYEPDLASSLNNLSNGLGDAGDNPGALAAIREAVEIYRRLAGASPARYEPDLAMSLNNLSNRLSEAGDNPGALAAIREAVEIRRPLARADPARYEPDLARSLSNLSIRLGDTGDNPGAVEAIGEAVEIYRRLAQASPARYEPDLASSLNNLSFLLSDAGDNPGALAAIREAVEIYRRLARANAARYEPDLAGSLNNLSNRLSDTGDNPGALEAIRQAVEIGRRLAQASPARYEPDLAGGLNNLSNPLSDAGDNPRALAAIREAVEIYRRLARASPARYEPDLARSLRNLGILLQRSGANPQACAAFKEAAALVRPFAQRFPGSRHARLLGALEAGISSTPGCK